MKSKSKLFKKLIKGSTYSVEFTISKNMLERFIALTGDRSSLHTDSTFARRALFRKNVIHGMLPVTFISALQLGYNLGYSTYFYKLSARFLRPVFVNDKLIINSKILEIDDKNKQIEVEYAIQNPESNSILITGFFTLKYFNTHSYKNKIFRASQKTASYKMIMDSLKEQDLYFEQIPKGHEKSIHFSISEPSLYALAELLKEGVSSAFRFNFKDWSCSCNSTNLLATCLFSTFVGVCIPGKYATFIDFNVIFKKIIQLDRKYKLIGKVEFKSESTATLVENIVITDMDNTKETFANGKINTKVNPPPVKMTPLDLLKEKEADLQLKNKVVLITGASRGIGETTAKLFSLYGAKVAVNYCQSKEDANRVVEEIIQGGGEAISVQADVSDRQQVKQMISVIHNHFGAIHILVNNAVRDVYPVAFRDLTWDDFQKDIDVNVKGAFNCSQEVIPFMLQNKGGKIINISTVFTDTPPPSQAKYVVSKSALVGLTRSMAIEFAPYNIQVNIVVPSIVKTDLTKHINKIFFDEMKNDTPMGRLATSVDVAKAVIFLASSLSSFTTGQKIMVTGGSPPFL